MEDYERLVIVQGPAVAWLVDGEASEGDLTAYCDALEINAFGDSLGDLQDTIVEVMSELLCALLDEGELRAKLAEVGWWLADHAAPCEPVRFIAPYELEWR